MIFLHPLALLGLLAVAIPALLHLFERRTPPEAAFPPLRYLTEAERRIARRLKLRHLLLLLLRMALVAVVVLAAAQPLVPTGPGVGGHAPTALVIVLDNSLSSAAIVGGVAQLDRLKSVARAVLQHASTADRLWVILADGIARAGTRQQLQEVVDSAPSDFRRLDLVDAVSRAARVVDGQPVAIREVHVVSDLQRSAIGSGRATVPKGVRVLALAPSGATVENRGVGASRVTEGTVVASIAGTAGVSAVPITLRIQGRNAARALAAPGTTVTLSFTVSRSGWQVGEVTLEPDELRLDDRRVVVWREVGPASVQTGAGAGSFVTAALNVLTAAGRVRTGTDVTIADRPGSGTTIVLPPEEPALLGEVNRALLARGTRWQFGPVGTPGPLSSANATTLDGIQVSRRLRLVGTDSGAVIATVNGEPWAVKAGGIVLLGSRLDTVWTALPTSPGFVPFLDAMVNRFARGDPPVLEREGPPRVVFVIAGRDTVGATVFGPDARESDLTPADAQLLRLALSAEMAEEAKFATVAFAGTRRREAGGPLLLLALLLALGEFGAAAVTR